MTRLIDLTGKRFGSVTVLHRGERLYATSKNACWVARCDCGTETTVHGPSLTKGSTTTCGLGSCRYTKKPVSERFDRFTIPEPNSGCLLWLGSCDKHGYGELRVDGKNKRASHVALELAGRPLPAGMFACHSCDNPYCVNEDHLFEGTQLDNVADMMAKGRADHSGLSLGRQRRAA